MFTSIHGIQLTRCSVGYIYSFGTGLRRAEHQKFEPDSFFHVPLTVRSPFPSQSISSPLMSIADGEGNNQDKTRPAIFEKTTTLLPHRHVKHCCHIATT